MHHEGFLICDGLTLQVGAYSQLFAAIGTSNGGDGDEVFDVPDCQGAFLRGVDDGAKRDPDATTRTEPAAGGASGDKAGSIQGYATAMPRAKFGGSVAHLPTAKHEAYSTSRGNKLTEWNDNAVGVDVTGGGAADSRPLNLADDYLLKYKADLDFEPAGVVIPVAGAVSAKLSNWVLCDGKSYKKSDNPELAGAIGTANGGDNTLFNVPNYQGAFVRGTANGNPRDPDAKSRVPAAPGGNGGDRVGSFQAHAAARPSGSPFEAQVAHLPTEGDVVEPVAGVGIAAWNDGSVSCDLASRGGDAETRPQNLYVDWFVCATKSAGSTFPIGALIAVPGDPAPSGSSAEWLACDGSAYAVVDYNELYQAIGTAHGGTVGKFNVPDLRGRFLRGVDHGTRRDPDAQSRKQPAPGGATGDNIGSVQDWATGKPEPSLTAQVPNLPTTDHQASAAIGARAHAAWNSGSVDVDLTGGDRETRPANVYVQWYIRAR